MTPENVVDLFRNTMLNIMFVVAIVSLPGLIIGLIISIFQAATQINEQSLTFIPKLVVTIVTLIVAGPWLLHIVLDFSNGVFLSIAEYLE